MTLCLDQLPFNVPARIVGIEWPALSESDAKRLRNLGFDEGMPIEALHGAPVGRDPLAIRIGRMTIAIRLDHARTISVELAGR